MKLMMFAALAAAVATPALAQTAPPPPAQDQAMPAPPAQPVEPAMTPPAPASDPAMTPPAPPAPAADPAMAPAAPATTPDANMSGATPAAPTLATGTYPMCSRTVVDQCKERSNARGERLHSTPRPRKR